MTLAPKQYIDAFQMYNSINIYYSWNGDSTFNKQLSSYEIGRSYRKTHLCNVFL